MKKVTMKYLILLIALLLFTSCAKELPPLELSPTERNSIEGEYIGTIHSSNIECPSSTKLFVNENDVLLGSYEFIENKTKVTGKLYDFIRIDSSTFKCNWKDKYGTGKLILSFSADMSSFQGKWSSLGKTKKHSWDGTKK